MGQAYVYIRKSRLFRDQQVVSPDMQIAAAKEYAAQFGDSDLVVLSDLNISGRKGRHQRPGFDALLTAIETGECSAVYSYSLSRLSRSVRDIMALADLCKAHAVPIRLARDTDPDPTTATGRAVLALLGVMAQLEADVASERALDAAEARRARGDRMGPPVHPNAQAVIEAYREAGTLNGAARLLSRQGIPTRNGNALWYPSAVRVILRRAAPDLLPRITRAGAKHAAPFVFYRLLRCHCGTTMTGHRETRRGREYVSYVCSRGRYSHHEKAYMTERVIGEWAVEEMARLRPPTDLVALAESTDAERAMLTAKLDRLRVAFLEGLIEEAPMRLAKADIDAALTRLDLQGRAVRVPRMEWDREPRDVNLALRSLWDHVELDLDLKPIRAEWLVPDSWLAEAMPGSPAARSR